MSDLAHTYLRMGLVLHTANILNAYLTNFHLAAPCRLSDITSQRVPGYNYDFTRSGNTDGQGRAILKEDPGLHLCFVPASFALNV